MKTSHFIATLLLLTAIGCGRAPETEEPAPAPETSRDRTASRVLMIETLLDEGQVASAIEQLRRLAEDPEGRISAERIPSWADGLVERMIRRRALGLADSLLGQMGPVAGLSPERQILAANLRVLQGRPDEAVEIYSRIRSSDPSQQVQVLHELATLHMRRGEWEAAIDRAREALTLDPTQGPLRVLIARAQVERGEARAGLDELTALPPSPARWMAEAEIQLDAFARPDTAVTLLMRARQQMPRDSGVALLLGRALIARGDPAAAIPFVEPLARRPQAYAGSQAVLIEAWEGAGRLASADSLRTLLDDRRTAEEVRRLRIEGLQFSQAGELDEALDRFERALDLDPANGELHHDRGVILARQERWDAAQPAFETAARLRPDDVSILVNLARLFDRTGRASARDSVLARVEALSRTD